MRNLIVGAVLLTSSVAEARRPVPPEQFTSEAHVWLARAMIAEAGWRAKKDHVGMAYVLARRWKRATERWPTMRFVDVIRNYCAGLGSFRRSLTARQEWLRGLDFNVRKPDAWPKRASWKRHGRFWADTLERSHAWAQGELRDPCRGRAWHWGGVIDSPRGRMVAIDCGGTRNTFYGMAEE